MENEIVIKTEVVKVSELNERERQIYNYAYERGREAATPASLGHKIVVMTLFFGWVIGAIIIISKAAN